MSERVSIPSFYLYGDPPREVEPTFVHVESLDDRSRPSEWTIAPHRHDGLVHLMLIVHGDGAAIIDGARHPFRSPALVIVADRAVHGFEWAVDSHGHVLTIAVDHVAALAQLHGEAADLFVRSSVNGLPVDRAALLERRIVELSRNLNWDAPGRMLAVDGILLTLIAEAIRQAQPDMPPATVSRAHRLVARYRERMEETFRMRPDIGDHAAALGVGVSTLRAACMTVTGQPPLRMQDERTMLEARRMLHYTTLAVSEIGYALGFADPAHFSRFFARLAGKPPSQMRRADGGAGSIGGTPWEASAHGPVP